MQVPWLLCVRPSCVRRNSFLGCNGIRRFAARVVLVQRVCCSVLASTWAPKSFRRFALGAGPKVCFWMDRRLGHRKSWTLCCAACDVWRKLPDALLDGMVLGVMGDMEFLTPRMSIVSSVMWRNVGGNAKHAGTSTRTSMQLLATDAANDGKEWGRANYA